MNTNNSARLKQQMARAVEVRLSRIKSHPLVRKLYRVNPSHAMETEAYARYQLQRAFVTGLHDGTGERHLDEIVEGFQTSMKEFMAAPQGKRIMRM